MKATFKLAAVALALTLPLSAQAHRSWIVPAATVISSDDPWVTFDAAVSNDVFHPDYRASNLNAVKVATPDGSEGKLENQATGKVRSTFDVNLKQKGTYKIYTASSGLSARWEDKGERKMWPARGTPFTQEAFEKEVPKKADKLEVTESYRRMETFVTSGNPSTEALKPTNVGLELVATTHPNDLFSGEEAKFQFLINGTPAAGAEIEVIPGATRYRTSQEAINVTTDKNGNFSIKWPKAGMYFLEATYADNNAKKPATKRSATYVATFEVLPQ